MASRWLTSVGKFLEKLDDQAKDVVEEQLSTLMTGGGGSSSSTAASGERRTGNNYSHTSGSIASANNSISIGQNPNHDDDDDDDGAADNKINHLLAARGLQLSFDKVSINDDINQKQQQDQTMTDDDDASNFFSDNDNFNINDASANVEKIGSENLFKHIDSVHGDDVDDNSQGKSQQDQQEHHTNGWGDEEDFDDIDMSQDEEGIMNEKDNMTDTNLNETSNDRTETINEIDTVKEPSNFNQIGDEVVTADDVNNEVTSTFNDTFRVQEEGEQNQQQQQEDDSTGKDLASQLYQPTETACTNNDIDMCERDVTNSINTGGVLPSSSNDDKGSPVVEERIQSVATISESDLRNRALDETETDIGQKDRTPATELPKNDSSVSVNLEKVIKAKLQEQESIMVAKSLEREEIMRNEYKNEMRNLKRTIAALNGQLELSEREINAQRKELDDVAIRMDKDRIKNKEIIDKLNTRYTTDITTLKAQHDNTVNDLQKQHDEQIKSLQEQYRQLELRIIQESDAYNKELIECRHRDEVSQHEYNAIVDEKETLLQQIATLQQQQDALGARLESLTSMSDNTFQREQDAERRYDEVLEIHAKQLQQRQIRESELERTIAELTAALASRSSGNIETTSSTNTSLTITNESKTSTNYNESQLLQIQTLEHENETIKIQLAHELARSTALEQEIQDITKERDDETKIITTQIRQQFEHTIAELQQQVDQYKQKQESLDTNAFDQIDKSSQAEESNKEKQQQQQLDTYLKKIKSLSDEIVRQREKLSTCSSEISTLRTRLNVALNRATVAEAVAEQQQQQQYFSTEVLEGGGSSLPYMKGPSSDVNNVSLRTKSSRGRRSNNGENSFPSMRKALMIDNELSSVDNNAAMKVGIVLDATDSALSKMGRILRYNPFARLFFVLYLLSLHTWTFVVIFFHAHSLDHYNNNLQIGGSISSPHDLQPILKMASSQNQPIEPIVTAADADKNSNN